MGSWPVLASKLVTDKERVEYFKSPLVGTKELVSPAAVHNAVSNVSPTKRVNFLKYYKDQQEIRVVYVDVFYNEPNNNLFPYKLSNVNKDL